MTTTTDAPTGHQVIATSYALHGQDRKRVHLRCTVRNCFKGHIDGSPRSMVDELVALVKATHTHNDS